MTLCERLSSRGKYSDGVKRLVVLWERWSLREKFSDDVKRLMVLWERWSCGKYGIGVGSVVI